MHEDPFDESVDPDDPGGVARPEPTGVGRVDAVVATVVELTDRPLEEHVAVFEQAHDELRRTLDDPGAGQDEA